MDWKLLRTVLFWLAASVPAPAAQNLATLHNQALFLPAARLVTNGVPGLTNAPARLMVSGITPRSSQGGHVALVNTQVWAKVYGTLEHYDQALDIAVDRSNNVCITGYSRSLDTDFDFLTIQYAPNGTAVWTNRYDGPAHAGDFARAMTVDGAGNFYVTGDSVGLKGGKDVATIKYSPRGSRLWVSRYNRSGTNNHSPAGIVTDAQGNAYVSVSTYSDAPDYTTLKYDALGKGVWTNRFKGRTDGYGSDYPAAIVRDDAGAVLVTGFSDGPSGQGAGTVKYAANGTALWTNHYAPGIAFGARAVLVDRQGNVTVMGENGVGLRTAHYYAMMRYSSDGTLLWTNLVTGPDYAGGNMPQLAADPVGNVFMLGAPPGVTWDNTEFSTLKLSPNGTVLWTDRFFDVTPGNQAAGGIAVDSAGNFYLTLYSAGPNRDLVTIKYAADGTRLWTNRFDGPAHADDIPSAVTVDGAGNVYITGYTKPSGGNWNYVTLKYADYLLYSPPTNFVGSDTFSFTATDDLGQTATGTVNVEVLPPLAFDSVPPHLKLTTAGFQMRVGSAPGTNPIIIYASTNLVQWRSVFTNLPVAGAMPFLDTSATNQSKRFYRAVQNQ